MPRSNRNEYPGGMYHIISRGVEKREIFTSDNDRNTFLRYLSDVISEMNWSCYAYCLMNNHYHILIKINHANLSQGIYSLNRRYAVFFNRLHDRVGHLYQGRFRSYVVDRDAYLLELIRYISLNPVRAGIVEDPADYKWSSYGAVVGGFDTYVPISSECISGLFGVGEQSMEELKDFVNRRISGSLPSPKNHPGTIRDGSGMVRGLIEGSDV